jgi:hypothetical protein
MRLDAITRARAAYAIAKTTLEAKLRERAKEELGNLQTQIDIAVRYAYDSGESKASILRAMGTKDWKTLTACLERTEFVTELAGRDPLDEAYTTVNDTLVVKYNNHGPQNITGMASFTIKKMNDDTIWLMAVDPLWNADYSVRNDVVAALDGKQDGYYYQEAMGWLDGRQF